MGGGHGKRGVLVDAGGQGRGRQAGGGQERGRAALSGRSQAQDSTQGDARGLGSRCNRAGPAGDSKTVCLLQTEIFRIQTIPAIFKASAITAEFGKLY